MYHRILVPLDGSPLAETALPHARAFAACNNAEVLLLRVVTYSLHDIIDHERRMDGTLADDLRAVRVASESYVEAVAVRLRPDTRVRTLVSDDANAASAITRIAAEQSCDLIVMTTHGRTGFVRGLLGSVADRVVRSASVPVLLVHGG